MASLIACATDLSLLARWSDAAQAAGHACHLVPPASLLANLGNAAELCVYDLGLRGGGDRDGLLAAVAAAPTTRFIALSARPQADEGLALLRAGVHGYANRAASKAVITALLASVLAGEIWAGPQVTQHLLKTALAAPPLEPASPSVLLASLTAREAEIAQQVAAGHSNKVIAADNGISERTVKAHLNSIFRKTGLRSRVQLALALSDTAGTARRLSAG